MGKASRVLVGRERGRDGGSVREPGGDGELERQLQSPATEGGSLRALAGGREECGEEYKGVVRETRGWWAVVLASVLPSTRRQARPARCPAARLQLTCAKALLRLESSIARLSLLPVEAWII